MSLPAEFWRQLPNQSDSELYEMLARAQDYLPEALEAVKAELTKRNLSAEQATTLEAQAKTQKEEEDAKPGLLQAWPRRIYKFILGEEAPADTSSIMNAPATSSFSFLPRSNSKIVFIIVMAIYGRFFHNLFQHVIYLFEGLVGIQGPATYYSHTFYGVIISPLIIAPVFESLQLCVLIEVVRRLKFQYSEQLIIPGLIVSGLHVFRSTELAFGVIPFFLISAYAYIYWAKVSRKTALVVIISMHFLSNFTVTLEVLGHNAHLNHF